MSSENASEILVRGARALAHSESLGSSVDGLLAVIAEQLDVESAVVVVDGTEQLVIVASVGLEAPALGGLTEAMRNPGHPIARTFSGPVTAFDVTPSVPGGPALRSHLPLTVTRDGSNTVLGVLALAHHRPLEPEPRRLLLAVADLALLQSSATARPADAAVKRLTAGPARPIVARSTIGSPAHHLESRHRDHDRASRAGRLDPSIP